MAYLIRWERCCVGGQRDSLQCESFFFFFSPSHLTTALGAKLKWYQMEKQ